MLWLRASTLGKILTVAPSWGGFRKDFGRRVFRRVAGVLSSGKTTQGGDRIGTSKKTKSERTCAFSLVPVSSLGRHPDETGTKPERNRNEILDPFYDLSFFYPSNELWTFLNSVWKIPLLQNCVYPITIPLLFFGLVRFIGPQFSPPKNALFKTDLWSATSALCPFWGFRNTDSCL